MGNCSRKQTRSSDNSTKIFAKIKLLPLYKYKQTYHTFYLCDPLKCNFQVVLTGLDHLEMCLGSNTLEGCNCHSQMGPARNRYTHMTRPWYEFFGLVPRMFIIHSGRCRTFLAGFTLSRWSKLKLLSSYTGKQQHYYVIILGGVLNERASRHQMSWVTDLGFQVAIFSVQDIRTVLISGLSDNW